MTEILRNKNLATRFQILVEIANGGPNIQQRAIADNLDITPQAVSNYIRQLFEEELIISDGRAKYRVTSKGVNWVIKVLRELRSYDTFVEKAITNISISTAVADADLAKGQKVGLEMREGLLFTTSKVGAGAMGTTTSDAKAGNDVGVSNIEGIVNLEVGTVTILKIPNIQSGGSQMADTDRLQGKIIGKELVGSIGIEALISLKKTTCQPIYTYGVSEAAIEAAKSGLSPVIVCADDATSDLIRRLDEEGIGHETTDLRQDKGKTNT
jgi:putative transcriptional regulator